MGFTEILTFSTIRCPKKQKDVLNVDRKLWFSLISKIRDEMGQPRFSLSLSLSLSLSNDLDKLELYGTAGNGQDL